LPALNQTSLVLTQGVLDFREEGGLGPSLTFSQAFDNEFVARVNKAFDSASRKPFAKENL